MNTTQNSAQEHNLQPFLFKLVLNLQCNLRTDSAWL